MAAASCAATFTFVATVSVSCGNVVPTVCAQQCPDLAVLQDRITALEGKIAALKPVVLLAKLIADQPVPSDVDTTVAVTAEVDTHHAFNAAHEYIAPLPGKYLITATVSYAGMDRARANNEIWITGANTPAASVRQNAVTASGNSSGSGATLLRINSATIVQLDQGDRVALRAFHDYGVERFVVSDAAAQGRMETTLQIIRIPDVN